MLIEALLLSVIAPPAVIVTLPAPPVCSAAIAAPPVPPTVMPSAVAVVFVVWIVVPLACVKPALPAPS